VSAAAPLDPAHRSLTIGIVMMVTVVAFQAMGVSTALPAVARDLDGLDAYGWAFSGFLLTSIVGMVAAGQAADRGDTVRPLTAAVLLFAAGSLLAAAAGSWPVLIGGRALQGLGNGAISALVFVAVARAYPQLLYGRMLAVLSSAWVLPALVGPGLGGLVAEHLGWRWVFLMLLPLLPVAFGLALPGLRGLVPPPAGERESRLGSALALAVGVGAFLGSLSVDSLPLAAALAAAGAAVGLYALLRLLPAGTLRLRRGLPSGIATRGLLAVGFIGGDAFLPLALTRLQSLSLTQAGLVVSAGSVSWSIGAVLQARLDRTDSGAGRPRRVLLGGAILTAGVAVTTLGLVTDGGGWAIAAAGWVISGLGMGIGYPSVGALALAQAPAGTVGGVSYALQLIETIGVALFTGLAGGLLAAGLSLGWSSTATMATVFAVSAAAAAAVLITGRRVVAPRY
jgi:MFS family permease